ncbi:MAG: KH domain-containing protein [Clostridiales bacterium]|jgi:predicted RNA-binding protein YlqC (UPF0109 family)|nr:KH domain-containing protein [Clostridiales bacterium]
MQDLVKFLVKELADTDDVTVIETEKGANMVNMEIYMKKSEIGKIIGKQGRIAQAIRTVIKAAAAKQQKRYNIVIKEKKEAVDTDKAVQTPQTEQEVQTDAIRDAVNQAEQAVETEQSEPSAVTEDAVQAAETEQAAEAEQAEAANPSEE